MMLRWTVQLEGGPKRVNHAAVAVKRRIFSFGGYCTGEDYENTRPMDVHILNTTTYRWFLLAIPCAEDAEYNEIPYQRYGHTAVAYDECAFIWGGRNDTDGACNKLFSFDTNKLKWSITKQTGEIPGARDGHSACVVRTNMYIYGGYEEEVDRFSNDVHALDLECFTWTLIQTSGKPARWRDFHSATAYGDDVYIFGGRSDKAGPFHTNHEIYCNKIQVFNTTTHTWHEPIVCGIAPAGRRSHSAFVNGNKLYIFGGYNGLHDVHFNDLHQFDPARNSWSLVYVHGKGPSPRRRQCCCLIDSLLFLFGGTSPFNMSEVGSFELNLVDQSDLHVLDFATSLKTLCLLAVQKYNLDKSCLPYDLRIELRDMTTNNTITRHINSSG